MKQKDIWLIFIMPAIIILINLNFNINIHIIDETNILYLTNIISIFYGFYLIMFFAFPHQDVLKNCSDFKTIYFYMMIGLINFTIYLLFAILSPENINQFLNFLALLSVSSILFINIFIVKIAMITRKIPMTRMENINGKVNVIYDLAIRDAKDKT